MMIFMDNAEFQLIYDGPALQTNEMDVRDLAPALVALADVIEEANLTAYGQSSSIQVNVKGSFKTGCFKVDLTLVQSFAQQVNNLFSSKEASSVAFILSILGVNLKDGFGLLPLIKWLKNRKIKKIIKKDDSRSIIEVDDEQREVENKVLDLYRNIKVRKSLEMVFTKPLEKEGVNSCSIKYREETFDVNDDEKDLFKSPELADEVIDDKIIETNLQAVSISFLPDNKWRFSDGLATFFAEVKDTDFIAKVQSNKIAFAKDDILKVQLHRKQTISEGGIKTEYEIIKIIDYRPSSVQIPLPFIEEGQTKK